MIIKISNLINYSIYNRCKNFIRTRRISKEDHNFKTEAKLLLMVLWLGHYLRKTYTFNPRISFKMAVKYNLPQKDKCKCSNNTEINNTKSNSVSNRFHPIRSNLPTFWQIIKTLIADPRSIQTQVWGCNSSNK